MKQGYQPEPKTWKYLVECLGKNKYEVVKVGWPEGRSETIDKVYFTVRKAERVAKRLQAREDRDYKARVEYNDRMSR